MLISETINQHISYRTLQDIRKTKNNENLMAKNKKIHSKPKFPKSKQMSKLKQKSQAKYKIEENKFMT